MESDLSILALRHWGLAVGLALGIFVLGEFTLARQIFARVRRHFGGPALQHHQQSMEAELKGVLERGFVFMGLQLGYPVVIVAFGALKLGTRFVSAGAPPESQLASNDYFLVGNLASLLMVFIYHGLHQLVFLHLILHG